LPSLRHSAFAFFCRISSDIGLASLVVEANASATPSIQSNCGEQLELPHAPNEKSSLRAALVACDLRSFFAPWPRIASVSIRV
jgi:hypothetical protein